jgi:hypothetical protein
MAALFCARMQTAMTRLMTRNSDTQEKFLLCFIQEFGFNPNAVTALYNVQMLKDTKTLSELDNDAFANICKALSKDTANQLPRLLRPNLSAHAFASDISTGPQERSGGPQDHL